GARPTPDTETTETPAGSTTVPPHMPPPAAAPRRNLYMNGRSTSGLILPGGVASPLVALSAEMVANVAKFLPPDMWWVAADLDQLFNVPGNWAAAMRIYAGNLRAAYPVDSRIVDMFEEFASAVGKTGDYPTAIAEAFRVIHEDDIKRRLAPRTNEHLWNV
ncbi:hypothetical protein, partial [Nonomuraea angiospora]